MSFFVNSKYLLINLFFYFFIFLIELIFLINFILINAVFQNEWYRQGLRCYTVLCSTYNRRLHGGARRETNEAERGWRTGRPKSIPEQCCRASLPYRRGFERRQ